MRAQNLSVLDPHSIPSEPYVASKCCLDDVGVWSEHMWGRLSRSTIQLALNAQETGLVLWCQDGKRCDAQTTVDSHEVHPHVQRAAVLILMLEQECVSDAHSVKPTSSEDCLIDPLNAQHVQLTEWHVVMTTRSLQLRHHPGQVSFVGGRMEVGETPVQAALREAQEEINLDPQSVTILGAMPEYTTVSGFAVAPIVGVVSHQDWHMQNLRLDAREVSSIFSVPLKVAFDVNKIRAHCVEQEHHQRYFLSLQYHTASNTYDIWGASLAMLQNFKMLIQASL